MITTKSLTNVLCDELQVRVDSEAFMFTFKNSLLYIVKGMSAFTYQHSIKHHTKDRGRRKSIPSAKTLRLHIAGSKYLSLSMKLFVLRLGKLKSITLDDIKDLAAEYQIFVSDAKRIYRLWVSDRDFRRSVKVRSRLIDKDSPQWSEEQLDEVFSLMYPKLQRHAKYLVQQKLRFVVRSTNMTYEDIINDLMTHVWARYFQVVPTVKEPQHLLNSLKKAITNEVNNLCDKYSTQKNGRLIDLGKDRNKQNTSMLLVVSENQIPININSDSTTLESLGMDDPYPRLDMQLSVKKVVNSQKDNRKQRLLRILLGAVDKHFTRWLRRLSFARSHEDNDDVQLRLSPVDFNALLARYLKVPMDKMLSFLTSVGRQINPEVYYAYRQAA